MWRWKMHHVQWLLYQRLNAQLLQSDEITFPLQIQNKLKVTPEIVSNHLKFLGESKAMGLDKIGILY